MKSALVSEEFAIEKKVCRRIHLHKPWTKLLMLFDHIVTSVEAKLSGIGY